MVNIPYGRQQITEEDIQAVTAVLQSDYLTTGPKVKEFEEKFAAYVGSNYAVAVANGTAALHLSAMALGVSQGNKVITTPITFAASANCVRYCGGTVDFCDIDPNTYVLDIVKVREKLETSPPGTYQGIIPVDLAGFPVDMEAFRTLAAEYNLWIIEDACHAPGGWFTDKKGNHQNCGNGKFANLSAFSFHPVKHIACGEGGMITTDNKEYYEKLLQFRSHGMIYQGNPKLIENHGGWYMEMQELGYNYRMPDILCALGISQLTKANQGLERRKEIAANYFNAFKNESFILSQSGVVPGHAYHLYIIEVADRLELYNYLRQHHIFAQIHYVPVHLMPYYKEQGFKHGDFPMAERYYQRCLSIPMYPSLTDEEQDFVIQTIKDFYNN